MLWRCLGNTILILKLKHHLEYSCVIGSFIKCVRDSVLKSQYTLDNTWRMNGRIFQDVSEIPIPFRLSLESWSLCLHDYIGCLACTITQTVTSVKYFLLKSFLAVHVFHKTILKRLQLTALDHAFCFPAASVVTCWICACFQLFIQFQ